MKLLDNPKTKIWINIKNIHRLRNATRYFYYRNKEKEKKRSNEYRKNNLKRFSDYALEYRNNDKWKSYYKNFNKEYRIKNKDYFKEYEHERYKGNRRLKIICREHNKKEGNKLMNIELYEQVFEYFKHKCHYCGSENNLVIDHKIPYSKGGTSVFNNLVVACSKCNREKYQTDYDKYIKNKETKNNRLFLKEVM